MPCVSVSVIAILCASIIFSTMVIIIVIASAIVIMNVFASSIVIIVGYRVREREDFSQVTLHNFSPLGLFNK